MRSGLFVKLALGCAAVTASGGALGVGLGNFVTTGSFEFYKQPRVAGLHSGSSLAAEPARPPRSVFASGDGAQVADATPLYASLDR